MLEFSYLEEISVLSKFPLFVKQIIAFSGHYTEKRLINMTNIA